MATENYTVTQLYENADVEYSPSLGRHTSGKLKYKVTGAENEEKALEYATAKVSKSYLKMDLKRLAIDNRLSGNVWVVSASYEYKVNRINEYNKSLPQETTKYSMSTTTTNIKFSRLTVGRYSAAGSGKAPSRGGGINVVDGVPQGCDIKIPVITMTITHYWKPSQFTTTLRNNVLLYGGYINSEEFRGFPARSLLYVGADIQEVDSGDRKITQVDFQFEISPPDDVEIQGWDYKVSKAGWEYLWVDYRRHISDKNELSPSAKYAYVERVYPACKFEDRLGLSAKG
ncbi:MAG: hypothetical protein IKP00_07030 [Victivallales bacterium]|nr:hypothetical protein [Victivallales bacterium]